MARYTWLLLACAVGTYARGFDDDLPTPTPTPDDDFPTPDDDFSTGTPAAVPEYNDLPLMAGPSDAIRDEFENGTMVLGDLVYSPEQYHYYYGHLDPDIEYSYVNPSMTWNKYYRAGRFQIAYRIVRSSFSSANYNKLYYLMKTVEKDFLAKTGIEFGSKDGAFRSHVHWMQFQGNLGGCWSHLGRTANSGGQKISLGAGCLYQSTTTHEIMHALGWHHEQNRADRDSYVQIYMQNVQPAQRHNFQIARGSNHFKTPYEVRSLMQYPSDAFAVRGRHTMRSLTSTPIPTSYQYFQPTYTNRGMTNYDSHEINNVYHLVRKCRSEGKQWQLWDSARNRPYISINFRVNRNTCVGGGTKPTTGPRTTNPVPPTGKPGKDCGKTSSNSQGVMTKKTYERGVKTKHQGGSVKTYKFSNILSYDLTLYWVTYEGQLKTWDTIKAGQVLSQQSYYSHTWAVSNSRKEVLMVWKSLGDINIDSKNVNYFVTNGCKGTINPPEPPTPAPPTRKTTTTRKVPTTTPNRCSGTTGPDGNGLLTKLAYTRGLRSTYKAKRTHYETIYNRQSSQMKFYYIDTNGRETYYWYAAAGGKWGHYTYRGHMWIAKINGRVVAAWEAGKNSYISLSNNALHYYKSNYC